MKDQYQQAADQALRALYAFREAWKVAGEQHPQLRKETALAADIETWVWGTPKESFGETFDQELPNFMLRMPFGGANPDENMRRLGFLLKDYTKLPKSVQPLEGESPNQWLTRVNAMVHNDIIGQWSENVFGDKTPEEEAELRKRQESPLFGPTEAQEKREEDRRLMKSDAMRREYMPTTRDRDPNLA